MCDKVDEYWSIHITDDKLWGYQSVGFQNAVKMCFNSIPNTPNFNLSRRMLQEAIYGSRYSSIGHIKELLLVNSVGDGIQLSRMLRMRLHRAELLMCSLCINDNGIELILEGNSNFYVYSPENDAYFHKPIPWRRDINLRNLMFPYYARKRWLMDIDLSNTNWATIEKTSGSSYIIRQCQCLRRHIVEVPCCVENLKINLHNNVEECDDGGISTETPALQL